MDSSELSSAPDFLGFGGPDDSSITEIRDVVPVRDGSVLK